MPKWLDYARPTGETLGNATTQVDGLMSASDKQRLDNAQSFRRVISQPQDGSDFFVTLPTPMSTRNYNISPTQAKGSQVVLFECPDEAASDRTTTTFRCITSATLSNGDIIDFVVAARTA